MCKIIRKKSKQSSNFKFSKLFNFFLIKLNYKAYVLYTGSIFFIFMPVHKIETYEGVCSLIQCDV